MAAVPLAAGAAVVVAVWVVVVVDIVVAIRSWGLNVMMGELTCPRDCIGLFLI